MANRLTTFGNDLYTGKRSFNFVGGRKKWYAIAGVLIILTVLIPVLRGVNFSIEFRGGSQFQIAGIENATPEPAIDAVASVVPEADTHVTIVGGDGVRVQTDQLEQADSQAVSTALAEAYGVPESEVTSSFIGPSWGADVTRQALVGLIGIAFGALDLNRLEADIDPRNGPSARILERLGFRKEGYQAERWIVAGEISDTALYGLLRRNWSGGTTN